MVVSGNNGIANELYCQLWKNVNDISGCRITAGWHLVAIDNRTEGFGKPSP